MTSLYRINYQLRAHKRDPLIEFIKAVLLTPFVLHAKPSEGDKDSSAEANRLAYADIMANVEELITV
jgi:IMP and pyridine-specific 5'-nucleotidase